MTLTAVDEGRPRSLVRTNAVRSTVSWLLCATLIALPIPARAQIGPSTQWGWSTAGGSGGTPTGPTNPGAYGYGTSSAGGSGGIPTGPLNPNAYGWGTSLGAGSGALPTGPTVRGLGPIPPDLQIMADPYARRAVQAYAGPASAAPMARAHQVKRHPARVVRRRR